MAEKLEAKDLPVGQHFWAIMGGMVVVIAKLKEDRYDVCGPWECGACEKEFEIVSLISMPRRLKNKKLYYG